MTKEPKTIYEPHPVTPERKAELRAQGYKILDAIYDPERYTEKDWREPYVGAITRESIAEMDGKELTDLLEAHGVEMIPRKLDARRDMLAQIMFVEL